MYKINMNLMLMVLKIGSLIQTMLWEIGKQIQLIAEMVARNCQLEWSHGPAVAAPTEADLKEWYQHMWHTTKWIQLHIPSHQRELYYWMAQESHLTEILNNIRTNHNMCLNCQPLCSKHFYSH
jgi:hypothetical protein